MLRPFRALLLDLDGTLVDSRAPTERAWRDWAFDRGLEASADEVARTCHGVPSVQHVATWAPNLDAEAESAALEAAQVASTEPVTAFPKAPELLGLMPAGRVAVVTSGTPELASGRLAAAGLVAPAVMVRAGDVEHGKPGPDPYLLAAQRLGIPPASCLVVEDAPAGVQSGVAAGCQVVGVAHTHECAELAAADACFPDLRVAVQTLRALRDLS
jgi:mannitol-1-/sugar-/sorbitol-6-phosphatase